MQNQILIKLLRYLIPNPGTLIAVGFLLFVYTAWAAPATQSTTPQVISYQGTLTDDAGQPITGNVDLTFRLYDQPTDGTALWTEAHIETNTVPVQDGLFHLSLGSLNPIPPTIWANAPLYLGIQIGNEAEMLPREAIGTVPFAMQSAVALTVPDRSIGSRHAQLSTGRAAATETINLTSTFQQIPGTVLTLAPETDQTYLITVVANLSVSDSTAIARLVVDEEVQSGSVILQSDEGWHRSCVSQTYLVDLSGGTSHTMEIQAVLHKGSAGIIWGTHTSITYLAVSQ